MVVDFQGMPMKYDHLKIVSDVIGRQHTRIELDVPGLDGKGWRRSGSILDTAELDERWRKDVQQGAQMLLEESWVPANDPHLDAKVFVCAHPYGTGSLLAEPGSGGTQRHARNRLMAIQSFFRRSSLWGFWFLDRLVKTELFFKNRRRRTQGLPGASSAADQDPYTRLFGSAQPTDVPESSEWWKRQQRDLLAMSDDAELGLMQAMVTVTANDSSPEMLAAIRRGPFAEPTPEEMIEYIVTRKRRESERPRFELFALEHVLSFQRRVHALKKHFFRRGVKTPLGRLREWWDRTEAQMRPARALRKQTCHVRETR
jgi:hypothetical protein